MKKFYLLLFVFVVNYTVSNAQSSNANPPAFLDNVDDAGIVHSDNNRLSVFPNPSNGNFGVVLSAYKGQNVAVMMIDMNGKAVSYRRVEGCNDHTVVGFNLSGLTHGMYVIKVINGSSVETTRLLVRG